MLAGVLALSACAPGDAESADPTLPSASSGIPSAEPSHLADADYDGYDVSFPQCVEIPDTDVDQDITNDVQVLTTFKPKASKFTVVGVNGELPSLFNPCFKDQLSRAAEAIGEANKLDISTYVTAANPGNEPGENGAAHIKNWPKSGENRYGACDNEDDSACAYEYGRTRAEADLQRIPGWLARVWIDVEPEYSWSKKTANHADLEAMVEAFEAQGKQVGIYSSPEIFSNIVGKVPKDSSLYGLDNWMLGATEIGGAQANCAIKSFNGGNVVMAQAAAIEAGEVDRNVIC